jgi:hypothetical protein
MFNKKVFPTIATLITSVIALTFIWGCGDEGQFSVTSEESQANSKEFGSSVERLEASTAFDVYKAATPFVKKGDDRLWHFELPAQEAAAWSSKDMQEIEAAITKVNQLIQSGEMTVEASGNAQSTSIPAAPAEFRGVNGVLSTHWWGFWYALDADETQRSIERLRMWSWAATTATMGAVIPQPFNIPVLVFKGGLGSLRSIMQWHARKGTGVLLAITWAGIIISVYPQW